MRPSVTLNTPAFIETFFDIFLLRFSEVLHLIGEPDFRDVRLRWEYGTPDEEDRPKLLAFQVHYCELQAWGQYRCRTKVVKTTT